MLTTNEVPALVWLRLLRVIGGCGRASLAAATHDQSAPKKLEQVESYAIALIEALNGLLLQRDAAQMVCVHLEIGCDLLQSAQQTAAAEHQASLAYIIGVLKDIGWQQPNDERQGPVTG
jgi:hypothetical protein